MKDYYVSIEDDKKIISGWSSELDKFLTFNNLINLLAEGKELSLIINVDDGKEIKLIEE